MTSDDNDDDPLIESKRPAGGREADRTVEIQGGALKAYIKLYGQDHAPEDEDDDGPDDALPDREE